MTREERRVLRLRQWAMRAADKINGVKPARAEFLGTSCDYAAEFMGHRCQCGHRPPMWTTIYRHVLATMESEGIE